MGGACMSSEMDVDKSTGSYFMQRQDVRMSAIAPPVHPPPLNLDNVTSPLLQSGHNSHPLPLDAPIGSREESDDSVAAAASWCMIGRDVSIGDSSPTTLRAAAAHQLKEMMTDFAVDGSEPGNATEGPGLSSSVTSYANEAY